MCPLTAELRVVWLCKLAWNGYDNLKLGCVSLFIILTGDHIKITDRQYKIYQHTR
jgi:hypothetical protein